MTQKPGVYTVQSPRGHRRGFRGRWSHSFGNDSVDRASECPRFFLRKEESVIIFGRGRAESPNSCDDSTKPLNRVLVTRLLVVYLTCIITHPVLCMRDELGFVLVNGCCLHWAGDIFIIKMGSLEPSFSKQSRQSRGRKGSEIDGSITTKPQDDGRRLVLGFSFAGLAGDNDELPAAEDFQQRRRRRRRCVFVFRCNSGRRSMA